MARVYISFEDLTEEKKNEILEAYDEEGVDACEVNELFYCQFEIDEEGEVTYE